MKKEKRLKELEESYHTGIMNKEEYLKKKKEIEKEPEEKEKKSQEEIKEVKSKGSDKILVVGILAIILIFAIGFLIGKFTKEQPKTIEDLHQLNIQGKLNPEYGYLYKGAYSFVKYNDFWYWQLTSQSGKTEYSFNFRYSPNDLENIKIKGTLNPKKFNNASQYYVTFNPLGNELTYIRLARLDYDVQMVNVFKKTPISACDRDATNITSACVDVPIITCENTEDIVVYFKESDRLSVEYKDNCIIINGKGFDIVKGVDRVLYNLYDIMEK